MKHIRSRKHAHTFPVSLLTTSIVAAAGTLSASAFAADAPKDAPALSEVKVQAAVESTYKADKSASVKLTQPLVDTPKTVQVLKKEMLQEQGAVSLVDALRNTPGITMQLGENGNTAAGDTFQMRGFSTQASTFVDGIRDLGAVTRDVFNLEQIEVVKGAAGTESGRGSSSGYINLISKLPTLEESSEIILTAGTDEKKRLSMDQTKKLDSNSALRLNVMVQEADAAGRNSVRNESVGIAPSVAFGLNTPTRVYLYSQHVRQNNVPDGGIPTIGMSGYYHKEAAIQAGAKVNSENFYGSNQDYEKIDADMVSAKVVHDLNPNITVQNLTRYGKSRMDRVMTGVNAISINKTTGALEVARTRQRTDQTNEIIANQTNLNAALTTGAIKHDVVVGMELLQESQLTLNASSGSTKTTTVVINGQTIPVPVLTANLYNPNPADVMVVPYMTGADTDGKTTTEALYLADTVSLTEALKLNAGVRVDHFKTTTTVGTLITGGAEGNVKDHPGYNVGDVEKEDLESSDTLLSWNAGVVFKPTTNSSVYASYANSQTPPGGANFALSATATNQANSAFDPQETTTMEVGTKWELLNKRLNVSVAVYRTENEGQVTQDPVTLVSAQEGVTRVDGAELAVVGQLTNFWQLSAGIAAMDSEQQDQVTVNTSTKAVTTNKAVRWSPDLTASVWTSYTWNDLTVGGGVRYVSDQKRLISTADPALESMRELPEYTVVDLMAAYKVSKNVNLRLNVNNVFDEEYIATLNNSGARMTLGAPVSAALSAEFRY